MHLSGSPHKAPNIISVEKGESAVSQIHSRGAMQRSAVSLVARVRTPGGRRATPRRASATCVARSGLSSQECRLGWRDEVGLSCRNRYYMCLESASPGAGGRAGARAGKINGWWGTKGSWASQASLSPGSVRLRVHRLALSNAVNAHSTQFAGLPVVYDWSVVLHPATFSRLEAGILVRIKYRHAVKCEFWINGKSFLV